MNYIILVGILLILFFFISLFLMKEGFQDVPLNPLFLEEYNKFSGFYNSFMKNWEKAIITSVQLEKPAPTESASSPPPPSRNELNEYITILSKKKDTSFPLLTDPLPSTITSSSLVQYKGIIPVDSTPYLRALEWMNQQISESQKDLGPALKGEGFRVEGFDNNMCQDLSQCFANNPELVAQLLKAQKDAEEKERVSLQDELLVRLKKINGDASLQKALKENQELVQKSENIQKQAQSGELLSQLNISSEPSVPYQLPPGANALNDLEKNDPAKYKEYSQKYKQLMDMKSLMSQINGNLR